MSDLAREITPVNIEEELKSSYLDYAMSVIVGRALPDVRDGLKPVHRRVLYAMNVLGNDWNKAYKKSARVVGDVIGKYHPHGDLAVYDTIVRMAQPFSLRYMLVDGQGNFGSIDGDSAAAMRYTEIRLAKIAHELMADLEKETVDFVDNYDGTEKIPDVMPTKIPNLLVNGSSGIAVGMATNIPPHNLTEVINGCLAYIDDEDISIEGLMEHIPGPDFPTAAIINGRRGIEEAYRTGRGKVYIRARAEVEVDAKTGRETIIVHEIPYQVNKARLIEKIAELVKEKRVEGISALTSTSGLNFIVCTYGDDLSIGISSRFLGQKVTRALAEVLEDEGMRGYLNANRDAPAFHRPGPLADARKAAPVPSVFPPNSFERKSTRVRTVLAVLTIICIALIALLGGTAGGSALAVGAPCAAVALNWLFVRNMIVHAPDFIRVVERYFLVLLAVAGLWFLSTGNLIVTTYVIPGLCLLALAFNAVLLIAFRGSFVTGYAKYLIYEMLLGLVPLALLAAGLITWPPLAIAAGTAAAALLAILLLVGRKQLAAEARKLFSLR